MKIQHSFGYTFVFNYGIDYNGMWLEIKQGWQYCEYVDCKYDNNVLTLLFATDTGTYGDIFDTIKFIPEDDKDVHLLQEVYNKCKVFVEIVKYKNKPSDGLYAISLLFMNLYLYGMLKDQYNGTWGTICLKP